MPKHEATDPITGQEIDFAHPVLSGTMTDCHPAETVSQCAADPHPFNVSRGQILNRLWEIGNISPEITRGSLVGQVKALAMVVAIEGHIPDRRAASAQTKPAPPQVDVDIYEAEWHRNQRSGKNGDPETTSPQEETASGPSSVPDDPLPTAEPIPNRLLLSVSTRPRPGTPLRHPPWRLVSQWPTTSPPIPGSLSPYKTTASAAAAKLPESKNAKNDRILSNFIKISRSRSRTWTAEPFLGSGATHQPQRWCEFGS